MSASEWRSTSSLIVEALMGVTSVEPTMSLRSVPEP